MVYGRALQARNAGWRFTENSLLVTHTQTCYVHSAASHLYWVDSSSAPGCCCWWWW